MWIQEEQYIPLGSKPFPTKHGVKPALSHQTCNIDCHLTPGSEPFLWPCCTPDRQKGGEFHCTTTFPLSLTSTQIECHSVSNANASKVKLPLKHISLITAGLRVRTLSVGLVTFCSILPTFFTGLYSFNNVMDSSPKIEHAVIIHVVSNLYYFLLWNFSHIMKVIETGVLKLQKWREKNV